MSHHKKQVEEHQASVVKIYCRLLRMFALKYWFLLLIGIASAILMGGVFHCLLKVLDIGVGTVSAKQSLGHQDSAPIVEVVEADGASTVVVEHSGSDEDISGEVVPSKEEIKKSKEEDMVEKANKWLEKINNVLHWCKIDMTIQSISLEGSITLELLVIIATLAFLAVFLKAACEFANRFSLRVVAARVVTDLRAALYGKILHQSKQYFSGNDVGKLMSRCTNDTNVIESVIATAIPDLTTAPIMILASVIFVVKKVTETQLTWQVWTCLLAMPVAILPIIMIAKLLKKYQHSVLDRISIVTSHLQEGFSGIDVIRTFNMEEPETQRFEKVNNKYFKSLRKAILADEFVHPVMQLSAILLGLVFAYVCYMNGVNILTFLVVGFAIQQAFRPMKDLSKILSALQKSAAAAERVFEIIDLHKEIPEAENPIHIKEFKNEIKFEHVTFSYNGNEKILDDINLTVPKGSMVALVGQTGSGKTTLASLLARFYDPTQGRISIDGYDLKDLAIADFRQLVGMVSQETFLFNETVEYNVKYGRMTATHDEVVQVSEQANVSEFIKDFPEGYNRNVGERGNALSGGQRQRVAIARAIMRNPPILILDEATSALDTVTEHLVQEALNNVMKDRTVMVIAHRLSTIKMADTILVLDHGRVVEQGNHQELMDLNGRYRKLHDIQFGAEEQ